jgi:hypothetical protein
MLMMREILQRSTKQRQAAIEHCAEKGIPIDEGVGVVDTDFASEPHSNISDSDSNFWEDLEGRRVKAGVAVKAWVNLGLAWRSPDVSECGTYETINADQSLIVRRLPPVASLRCPHG